MESGNDEVEARALKIIEEDTDQDWRVYQEATAPAEKVRDEAMTKAFQTCREVEAQARKICGEAVASAIATFRKDTEPAWEAYLKARARKEAEGAPDEPVKPGRNHKSGRAEAQ